LRCRELLREIARSKEMIIYAGSINRDHVHMLIGIPPNLSVSKAVQFLKGKSSHKMLNEFPQLKKRYWGQHLWARGYWVATSGNVTDEVWKAYRACKYQSFMSISGIICLIIPKVFTEPSIQSMEASHSIA